MLIKTYQTDSFLIIKLFIFYISMIFIEIFIFKYHLKYFWEFNKKKNIKNNIKIIQIYKKQNFLKNIIKNNTK